jgi:glycosyltransferase involved in cell wall biosynthesis
MTGPACVIPAFNAGRTLADVVAGVREAVHDASVVVVDDGSRDETGVIAATCADHVVRFPANRGKGAALRAGIQAATARAAAMVFTIDADGQHDPTYAPRLLAALVDADLVVGVRARCGSAMPWHRRVSNAVSAAVVSACVGRAVADSQSGFRAFRAEPMARLSAVGDRYEYETDVLIQAVRAGLRIAWVAIPTIYGAPSHFRPVRDSARIVRTMLRRGLARPGAGVRWRGVDQQRGATHGVAPTALSQ